MKEKRDNERIVLLGGSGIQSWRYLARIDDFEVTVVAPASDSGGNTGFINMFEGSSVMVSGDLGRVAAAFLSGFEQGVVREFLSHRITFAPLKGYTVGNIAQVAAHELTGSHAEAITLLSKIFPFNARLLLATDTMPVLCAAYASGGQVRYEHAIDASHHNESGTIERLWTEPEDIRIASHVDEAVRDAQYIILGPGDLFTSKGAVLVVPGMKEAIADAQGCGAVVIDVVNLMTKVGHTPGFTAREHVDVVIDQFAIMPDAIFVNDGEVSRDVIARYEAEGAELVRHTIGERYRGIPVFADDLIGALPEALPKGDGVPRSLIRHDPIALHALFLKHYRVISRARSAAAATSV